MNETTLFWLLTALFMTGKMFGLITMPWWIVVSPIVVPVTIGYVLIGLNRLSSKMNKEEK